MTSSAPLRCKCRKQAETGLRCSRCFIPICPDCSRPAPVGMLCPDCARGKPSHLYQVDPKSLLVAIPVTLAAALFGGWLMASIRGLAFFGVFAGLIYGLGVAEVALRMTGRKRGLTIELMAGLCVLIGLIGGHAFHLLLAANGVSPHINPLDGEPYSVAVLALMLLMDPWIYVTAAVAVFGAVSRVRNI